MKVFVFEYIDKVSEEYHEGGGLLIVAKTEERAKELINAEEYVNVTAKEWTEVVVIDAMPDAEERLIVFPDAGCC